MDHRHIEEFSKIPQPERSEWRFLQDLRAPLPYHFQKGSGCAPGVTADCMACGADLVLNGADVPETALESLRRVLKAKGIAERKEAVSFLCVKNVLPNGSLPAFTRIVKNGFEYWAPRNLP